MAARPAVLLRENYRQRAVVLCGGLAVGGGTVAAVVAGAAYRPDRSVLAVALASLAAVVIGILDDLYGDPTTKGLRGHLGPLRHGRVTPGAAKFAGLVLVGVAVALVLRSGPAWRWPVDALVVAGTANLVNLLDLRPGRAVKGVLLAGVPVAFLGVPMCAAPLGLALGFLGPDLRERAMLGDGGANALGAVLGTAVVLAAAPAAAVLVALAVVALTVAGELASFTDVIERTAVLRWADRLGRPA